MYGNLMHERRQTSGKGHNLVHGAKITGYASGKMRKLESISHTINENKLPVN